MSQLSKALKGPSKSPLGWGIREVTGANNRTDPFSGASTGFDANQSDPRIADIQKKITAGQAQGTYGEGAIAVANREMSDLKSQVEQGKLSQADFAKIGSAIIPQMRSYISQLYGSGSRAADAAKAAGGEQFLNDINRDYNIYSTAQQVLGRDLTTSELNQLRPVFAGPNGMDSGKAYLSKWADEQAKSPTELAKKAGNYAQPVGDIFQSLLNRGATKDEVGYFGSMLASGQVTPYQVNQFVQALPEYQTNQDKQFRSGLASELSNYDQNAFNQQKQNILSSYAKSGMGNSTALDYAMTDTLSKMAQNRDSFIGGLSAQQYQGNKDAARADYQTSLNRLFGQQDYNQQKTDSQMNYLTQRADQGTDYQRQMSDYLNFMNSQPKQSTSGWDYLNAGLGIANTGANIARLFA